METEQLHLSDRFSRAIDYARHLHIERRKGTRIPYDGAPAGRGLAGDGRSRPGAVSRSQKTWSSRPSCTMQSRIMAANRACGHRAQFRAECGAHGRRPLRHALRKTPTRKKTGRSAKRLTLNASAPRIADIQLISAADKLYNARTILDEYRAIGPRGLGTFHRGRDQQIWYFDTPATKGL